MPSVRSVALLLCLFGIVSSANASSWWRSWLTVPRATDPNLTRHTHIIGNATLLAQEIIAAAVQNASKLIGDAEATLKAEFNRLSLRQEQLREYKEKVNSDAAEIMHNATRHAATLTQAAKDEAARLLAKTQKAVDNMKNEAYCNVTRELTAAHSLHNTNLDEHRSLSALRSQLEAMKKNHTTPPAISNCLSDTCNEDALELVALVFMLLTAGASVWGLKLRSRLEAVRR